MATAHPSAQTLIEKLRVYLVIGSQDCGYSTDRTIQIVREALAGGVGAVQFRDKGSRLHPSEQMALAAGIQELCQRHQALFVVNDDVSLAIRLKADGVHVGQEDMDVVEVRRLVPPGMIIGVSAGSPAEAQAAKRDGADYIGVGAMYPTASKADAGAPIGPQGLAEIRAAVGAGYPIVGIGGIQEDNAAAVIAAGANGLAVISAITKANDPGEAARRLRRLYRHDRT
ncbi:MAG: thiamine phosphate synthase [Brevibacillus sp.]|nr:thiamine phosphate synthase [Brevibacillus sp.]